VAVSQSIAVINAGSSSIKFALYDVVREEISLFRGQIGGVGVAPRLKVADSKGEMVEERALASKALIMAPPWARSSPWAPNSCEESLLPHSVTVSFTVVCAMIAQCG
jgi:hypothetical protein